MKRMLLALLFCTTLEAKERVLLLELFTSEGCSSCPPADRLLEELDRRQPVEGVKLVVLSEHVDYWDHIGWKDRFSQHLFSERQEAYSRYFKTGEVYTPQLVVQGKVGVIGNQRAEVNEALRQVAQQSGAELAVEILEKGEKAWKVRVKGAYAGADLWWATAMDQASTAVKSGENAGRQLKHVAVVQKLTRVGAYREGAEVVIPMGGAAQRLIVFVQKPGPGEVLAVEMVR